jgi:hypothetical protein
MGTTLARKQLQFPGSDAASKDDTRSYGRAASSSFTRNSRGQSATEQRALEREVVHRMWLTKLQPGQAAGDCSHGPFTTQVDATHLATLVTRQS